MYEKVYSVKANEVSGYKIKTNYTESEMLMARLEYMFDKWERGRTEKEERL